MWILLLCFLTPDNQIKPIMKLNDVPYKSYRECDDISNNSFIQETFKKEFPEKDLVFHCVKIN